MTATAIDNPLHKALHFWDAPIGKKTVMAVTGMILFGFVLLHMAGACLTWIAAWRILTSMRVRPELQPAEPTD